MTTTGAPPSTSNTSSDPVASVGKHPAGGKGREGVIRRALRRRFLPASPRRRGVCVQRRRPRHSSPPVPAFAVVRTRGHSYRKRSAPHQGPGKRRVPGIFSPLMLMSALLPGPWCCTFAVPVHERAGAGIFDAGACRLKRFRRFAPVRGASPGSRKTAGGSRRTPGGGEAPLCSRRASQGKRGAFSRDRSLTHHVPAAFFLLSAGSGSGVFLCPTRFACLSGSLLRVFFLSASRSSCAVSRRCPARLRVGSAARAWASCFFNKNEILFQLT